MNGDPIKAKYGLSLTDILSEVSVMNTDDGERFIKTDRLDAVSKLLWGSEYRRINADGLFHLYSKKPLEKLKGHPAVIVSTHVDCERGMTQCFSGKIGEDTLLGTFDNAITNASAVSVMLNGDLPDDVLFAFTGDEEYGSTGARSLADYLEQKEIAVKHIFVLDVTGMAWDVKADFTIENDLWNGAVGEKIVRIARNSDCVWRFVPEDPETIPEYVEEAVTIFEEAAADESWEYDELGLSSCSFCIPVYGNMHCNSGVRARLSSFIKYTETLRRLLAEQY